MTAGSVGEQLRQIDVMQLIQMRSLLVGIALALGTLRKRSRDKRDDLATIRTNLDWIKAQITEIKEAQGASSGLRVDVMKNTLRIEAIEERMK